MKRNKETEKQENFYWDLYYYYFSVNFINDLFYGTSIRWAGEGAEKSVLFCFLSTYID
ncbi:UNVERIFIED_ORG: hypothetical protein QFZ59_001821 [Bacillus sp. B2I3]|nr:hypothetical protein [Bacillus sp. B2I3]